MRRESVSDPMQRPRLVVLILLAITMFGAAWLVWSRGADQRADLATAENAAENAATVVDPADAHAGITVGRPAADASGTRTTATTGEAAAGQAPSGVRVTARWPDAAPAEGVMIFVQRAEPEMPAAVLQHAVTDARGVVTFAGLSLGPCNLLADRGDRLPIEVVAGPQDVLFELKGGIAVRGTVTNPDGVPVAGAVIWLQTTRNDWSGGRALTTSDAGGAFALTHVDASLSLGAIAAGYAPSKLVDLDLVDASKPPAVVVLQLQSNGGRLVGTVTDATGQPIADAIVATGKRPPFLSHEGRRIVEQWSARIAMTDDQGRFAIEGLACGTTPVAIRADGFGFWRDEVEIQDQQTTTIQPQLLACAVLTGTVTDGAGQPLAAAAIRAYDRAPKTSFIAGGQIDFDATFGYVAAVSDTSGLYRIEAVTPGTVFVFAQRGGERRDGVSVAYTTTELEVAPGAVTEWNPIIADGRAIEGIVLFGDGHPMPHVFVTLTDERSGREHVQTNDGKGVFRFLCLDASTYAVRVQYWHAPKGTPALQQSGLVPDRGRIELRAPFGRPVEEQDGIVIGRVDDVARRIKNPQAATVTLHSDANWGRDGGKIVEGVFRFERVTPCRFRLTLKEGTNVLAQGDWFELQPAATMDTGVLRTVPGGSAKIYLARQTGTQACEPKLYLRQGSFGDSTVVDVGRNVEVVADNLTPGEYEVTGYATGMVSLRGSMTVKAAETTELRFTMQAGALCRFEVWFPAGATAAQRRYRILDTQGKVFHAHEGAVGSTPTRPLPVIVSVPVGDWTMEFTTDGGLAGTAPFKVANAVDEVLVRVDLK